MRTLEENFNLLHAKSWWAVLGTDLQELLEQSFILLAFAGQEKRVFRDYSFIVFPAAKAYEGFLKKTFYDMHLISEKEYLCKYFRIGRSLNPAYSLNKEETWVYEKLTGFCKGEIIPQKLWHTWKLSRNVLFHWFPLEKNAITYKEAQERLLMILDAIDALFGYCSVQ